MALHGVYEVLTLLFYFVCVCVWHAQINDRLEFPLELDIYPFTKEGRAAAVAAAEGSGQVRKRLRGFSIERVLTNNSFFLHKKRSTKKNIANAENTVLNT